MAEKTARRWPKIVGYPAFFIFALLLSFFLTFPYDGLKARVVNEASRAGYDIDINSMGPGFFSLRASGIDVAKKSKPEAPTASLRIDSVAVSPTLLPPGLSVKAKAFGGTALVRVSGISNTRVRVDLDELDMSKGNLKEYLNIDMMGTVDGHLDLTMPRTAAGPGPAQPDLEKATGSVSLQTKDFTILSGEPLVTLPMFGTTPTPLPLPKIIFGDVNGLMRFENGTGTIDEFKSKSPNIEFNITGTMRLAKKLEYSEMNLDIRYKADPEWQKGLGLVGMAISAAGPDPKEPGWRLGHLGGLLGRPRFP